MYRFLFILILLNATCVSIHAERFTWLNENMGLSSRRCYSMVQDQHGFIWISTKSGIDRYDGHRFKNYKLTSPTNEYQDKIDFNYVCLSPDGSIWTHNHSGDLYKYNHLSDQFDFIYATKDFYGRNSSIIHVFFEENNILYLSTTDGGLRLDVRAMEVIDYPSLNGMTINQIQVIDELFYVSTRDGLFILRQHGKREFELVSHLLKDEFVNLVYYDTRHHRLWIGTFSGGIYILPLDSQEPPLKGSFNIKKPIRSIIQYNDDQVAIGIDGEGVLLVNTKTLKVENKYIHDEKNPYSLRENAIYSLLLDKQKMLWVSTSHTGVFCLDYSTLLFQSFTHLAENKNSLSNNFVTSAYEDKDGDFWFGTNDGLNCYTPRNGQWKQYFREEQDLVNKNIILSICEDFEGRIWVGGYSFGIAEINKKTGYMRKHSCHSADAIIGTDNIYSVYHDKYSGKIWTGGIYGKISCFDPKTRQTDFYREGSLNCFASYDENSVLFGLSEGLFLSDKDTKDRKATKIKGITVNSIYRQSEKTYWIGTISGGLFYYDLKNDSLKNYTVIDGLSSNHIYSVEMDRAGKLWLGTENGLNCLNPTTGEITEFTSKDGLISNQFTRNSSFRCSSGELLFGSADGGIFFDPDEIKKDKVKSAYPLSFTGFHPIGLSIEEVQTLAKAVNESKQIILPHNRNYFTLSFTMPNYLSSYKTEYSCFMDGYDLNWSNPSPLNTINYSKLPPGTYTFHVRAYIEREFQKERVLSIVIKQPWWNSTEARICYFVAVIILIYLIIKVYVARQKRKQTAEKIDFFINTAHDILTPLQLIEAPLNDLSMKQNATTETRYLLSLAMDNCRKLNHFVHQLIDLQRIVLDTEQLVVTPGNIKHFFAHKQINYQAIASQKFISLKFRIPETDKEIYFDKQKLSKIVDCLLSNAIKYTPYGGSIDVSAKFSGNDWSFTVKDSGIGINSKNRKMVFKHLFRVNNDINTQYAGSGIGLKMAHSLAKIHKGKISFKSKEAEGSEFTVFLPYEYNKEYIGLAIAPDTDDIVEETIGQKEKRLFLIQSEVEMSAYLHNAFSQEWKVMSFFKGIDALAQVSHFNPQVIIVDSVLSDMTGLSFCKRIKDNSDTSHIPVIMITDTTNLDTLKKIFSAGATDFIKKPFQPDILSLKITNLLSFCKNSLNKILADTKQNNIIALNNDRDQEFMDKLMLFIEKNLDNPELSIGMICKEFALSRTLLYNRITQLTQSPPNEFIRTIRLKNAAQLLLTGQYSVTEISNMVGIDNPKYFSRIFKDHFKVSPKNYGS